MILAVLLFVFFGVIFALGIVIIILILGETMAALNVAEKYYEEYPPEIFEDDDP